MPSGTIFISYRREDTGGHAGRIYDRLIARFPDRVFMDVVNIKGGEDFFDTIRQQVVGAEVFVILIGHQWATIKYNDGRRRLDDPDDVVRFEVSGALSRSMAVIPLLVEGAVMPDRSALPEDLALLTRRNALQITDSDFDHDVERLIERLSTIFGAEPPAPPQPLLVRIKSQLTRRVLIIASAVAALLAVGAIAAFLSGNTAQPPNVNLDAVVNSNNRGTLVNTNTATPVNRQPDVVAPPGTTQFVNSISKLDGKLIDHYADFSFYYPNSWQLDPNAGVSGATNFVKVKRLLPPDNTQESFSVGWYSSTGSEDADRVSFPILAQTLSTQFERSGNYPEYRKVSEGETRLGVYGGYEFRFEGLARATANGDVKIWGRVIFLPPIDRSRNGVTLSMMATSLAPGLESVNDVGEKGQTPIILRSFRLGPTR